MRTCPTRRTPTTEPGSPARRASASCTFAPCWATRRGARAGRSNGSTRGSTCKLSAPRRGRHLVAIPKVMGIETEYGISGPGAPDFNPVLSSSMLITAYAGTLRRIRWDYEQESPLRDARGFEPVQDRPPVEEDVGLANVILPNGARYYVDHAHPEYSTPECASARQLVVHDRAGERIVERSLELLHQSLAPGQRVTVYKNNTDGKGNSYGTHENYLVDRKTPFSRVVRDLTPFLVTRQDRKSTRLNSSHGYISHAVFCL